MWAKSSGLILIPGHSAGWHNVESAGGPSRANPRAAAAAPAAGYTRVSEPVANPMWRSFEELLPSPGNGHPSPSDPSRVQAGIVVPSRRSCPARSAFANTHAGARAYREHSIRKLLTRRVRKPCSLKNEHARRA